jgi:hypothetical protein
MLAVIMLPMVAINSSELADFHPEFAHLSDHVLRRNDPHRPAVARVRGPASRFASCDRASSRVGRRAGDLCMAALIAFLWLQPLIVHRSRDGSLPAATGRWLALVALCLFVASLILQGRGFFKHRKARHAG